MKYNSFLLMAWLMVGVAWPVTARAQAQDADILAGLRPEHPRLLITSNEWDHLRARRAKDAELEAVMAKTISDARAVLNAPTLVYQKEGKRLLAVSREALRRITLCSFAYRVSGERAFLQHAQQDMLTVSAFKDWNPSHFLDVAEMTTAVALGYDWGFDALPADVQATLRQAIIEKGIQPGLPPSSWQKAAMNWNQVCFGGLTLGALAVAEENPEVARQLLTRARSGIANGLKPYARDGVYPEGPGYWSYGTTYQVLMISALQTALGTDWKLSAAPGFLASAPALVEQIGPTGEPFNFSDGGGGVQFEPTLFWFAQRTRQPELVYAQNQLLRQALSARQNVHSEASRFLPLLALWVADLPPELPAPTRLPLAWHGNGPNPVGVYRSSWTDSNALFLAFKGGSAHLNHAHMDAGSFVLDANGVRWASDLGAQDYYSIESKGWALFDNKQTSDRWRVYRLNNFSHNTLTLGGQLHTVAGDARITSFSDTSATINLTPIFAGQAGNVTRTFSLAGNKTVLIRDDLAAAKPGLAVRWQMVTHTQITVNNNQATLRERGQTLAARILSPADARFEIASAQPPNDGVNQPNRNAQILAVNLSVPASGNLTVEIELQPEGAGQGN